MSRVLLPLVPLYAAAAGAKNLAYARSWLRPRHLQGSVVSIGNLSVGGSGKTPLTIRLAELLRDRGLAVDVLSRGYARASNRTLRVDPAGSSLEYGDEPLLIARSARVPVYVSSSRYAAGVLAEREWPGPLLHLLDDGFQHRRLARDLDIVAMHRTDFQTGLLPAGRLREPFSSLSRAQIVALRDEDRDLETELRARGFHQPIWWISRRLEIPQVSRAIAFCAIAHPDDFFSRLRMDGVNLTATRSWRDHHRYTSADVGQLLELLRQHDADAFLTTQKDLVRLSPGQLHSLESVAPVHGVRLIVRLSDESAAIGQLLDRVPAIRRS